MRHATTTGAHGRTAMATRGAMGWLGLEEHVEPVLRRIVCGYFGRTWSEVCTATRLTADLGATSLDLARVAVEADRALGTALGTGELARVRTFADLVDVAVRGIGRRARAIGAPPVVRVRVTPTSRGDAPFVERIGRLTPYLADATVADARRLRAGGRVDVWLPADVPWSTLVGLSARTGALAGRGVRFRVHRTAAPAA